MAKDPRVTRIEDLPGPKSKGEMDEMKMPYEEYCKKLFDVGNEHTKPIALKGIRWLSCTPSGRAVERVTRPGVVERNLRRVPSPGERS